MKTNYLSRTLAASFDHVKLFFSFKWLGPSLRLFALMFPIIQVIILDKTEIIVGSVTGVGVPAQGERRR